MGSKRILLVDSGSEILELFRSPLESSGWKTKIVSCGFEAMDLAIHRPWDAIIIDLVPPDLEGLKLARQMEAHPSTHGIPKIFLTADNSLMQPDTCWVLGVVGAIAKPFYPKLIPEQLADLLGWSIPPVQAISMDTRDKRDN